MSDIITGPGFYRQNSGQKAEIVFERDGYWYGREVRTAISGNARRWKPDGYCQTTALHEDGIAGPWIDPPAFKPGDLVLVDCPRSKHHQHYGSVETVTDHAPPAFGVRLMNGKLFCGWADTLKPVTLPAPLPAGYRLKPRNVKPVKGVDRVILGERRHWASLGWDNHTAEESEKIAGCPYFFAEPIPVPEPPTVDVGEGWRLLEEGEMPQDGDECRSREDIKDTWEPCLNWMGNRPQSRVCIYRRRVEQPFRISDHGPGIYETREGKQEPVTRKYGAGWAGPRLKSGFEWCDDGRRISYEKSPGDLVKYIGPLPEEWTAVERVCFIKWTRGSESKWLPIGEQP